jgi:hypothetical protein
VLSGTPDRALHQPITLSSVAQLRHGTPNPARFAFAPKFPKNREQFRGTAHFSASRPRRPRFFPYEGERPSLHRSLLARMFVARIFLRPSPRRPGFPLQGS